VTAISAGAYDFVVLTITPGIAVQPVSRVVSPGQNASFTVVATGAESLSYQWLRDGVKIPEATNATYSLNGVETNQAGTYTVVVSRSASGVTGSVTSMPATLTVARAPIITTQPASQTLNAGQSVSFGVEAVGAQPLSYQWRKDDVSIPEATNATYTQPVVQANQAGGYTVVVANSFGSVTSAVATLAVVAAPIITTQPVSQTLEAGQNGWLTLRASGTPPLFYQWSKDGVGVDGATASTFSLGKVRPGQVGSYTVVVSNSVGTVTSGVATVSVYGASFGAVVAWGTAGYVPPTVPDGLSEVTDIAAGVAHGLALKPDGTVVAWGSNGDRQTSVPVGLGSVAAIAAGSAHSVALKEDGTVAAWGETEASPGSAASISGAAAIAAGSVYTLVLKRDGTVMAWGDDLYGDTRVPVGLEGVTTIAAGARHAAALKQDGTVVAWGWNQDGQTDIPADLSGVTAVAAGASHTVALKQDGTVVAWGRNTEGQTTVPAGLSEVTAIAAGRTHTVALKQDGTVVAWGDNTYAQAAVPVGLKGVTAIAAGGGHTVALVATALVPPEIIKQPSRQRAPVGGTARFTVGAHGSQPFTYQWRHDGLDIESATTSALAITNLSPSQSGRYDVVVKNPAGMATSDGAQLTLVEPSRLDLQRLSGYPMVTFHGTPGNSYSVQYSAELTPTNWLTLVVFTNLASIPTIFIDITPATNEIRFYRAVDE
jgi:hypothetical protein